ncbi:PSD1 and planctomycete cytochrome C domain-containing protein [Crateriforma conspicua]|uniref:PSD1 and planctomycete cytochrome C domain-containing protein n=1 Tax=Crateriforma conspicua TaxID=2527996 RepID=UPI0011896FC3|nr:PSD1 and planctomycete cytochrome C domain-containing protein [Crateriforma conspicua]QDV60907.1 Planctomycete cytochrome C [Crateriforma conspicua]
MFSVVFRQVVRCAVGKAPHLCFGIGLFLIASTVVAESANDKPAMDETAVDFAREVQPILAKHCYACHGPDEAEGGLRLTDRDGAMAETDSGEVAIVPGDADASHLIERITADEDSWVDPMPPEGDRVSAADVEILRRWIDQGAPWKNHWAFEPVSAPEIPAVPGHPEISHPIDAFVTQRLQQRGLTPNGPADRPTLIRRLYYDLIGIPPTARQIQRFVDDPDPRAYEQLVDHLLRSPHYGERWGRHWLDLVRYAETNSFERDNPKPNAWKYRDYVIRSFNQDKPYDQFVIEQLAGDELSDVTTETLTATGFYRLGIWDDEPADPEHAFYDEMDDLVTTVGQAFLGLTINCARCHDHKIDPIPQSDYYSFLAFFGDVTTYGVRRDQTGNNQIDVSKESLQQQYADLDRQTKDLENQLTEIEQRGIASMSAENQRATEGRKADREAVLEKHLRRHLSKDDWRRYESLRAELRDVRKRRRELPARQSVLGLARLADPPRETFVLFRGSPHSPTDEVDIAFPELFDSNVAAMPAPTSRSDSSGRRLALAHWIVDPENRLASRVIANRIWQHHFGRGIVRSTNNFGQLGTPPTHPALLDWLANRFVDGGWRFKSMHRLIVTSEAYRRSSDSRPDAMQVDPANDLFWRFDRRRLSAEEIRDSMLKVNGSLNDQVYGPSMYPTLSREVMQGQSRPGEGWGNSEADDQNRRSIYIHVKRSLLTPMMTVFDFPDPDRSCEARFMTLQPGQALALLNGDFAHQQAARLAKRMDANHIDDSQLVNRCVRRVLGRDPTQEEIAAGRHLMQRLVNEFEVPRERAAELYCLSVMNWNEFLFVD